MRYRIWDYGWEEIVEAADVKEAKQRARALLQQAADEEWNGGCEEDVIREACVQPVGAPEDDYEVISVTFSGKPEPPA